MNTATPHLLRTALLARWAKFSPREQHGLSWLGVLLAVLLGWRITIAPALDTLRSSETQHILLAQQMAQMQALQAQAKALQQRPVLSRDEALRTLQGLSQPLGKQLELSVQGERVAVQIKAMPAQALAQWLTQARTQAQALPIEAHWVRQTGPQWDGTLVLRLPSASTSNQGGTP
jgi:general secretion pathway protein M